MSNDTTIPSNAATSTADRLRVIAELHRSDLGDQVSLWTDWAHNEATFPVDYLTEVIAALQNIQDKLNGESA